MLHHIEGDATASVKAPGVPEVATERQGARERGREKVSIVASSTDERAPFPPPHPPPPSRRALRALFCTLEFSAENFSGNGTLAQACVRGLASAGVDVVVAAARPTMERVDDDEKVSVPVSPSLRLHGASALVEVPVPRTSWGRLDARSPWRDFRDGAEGSLLSWSAEEEAKEAAQQQQQRGSALVLGEGRDQGPAPPRLPSPSSSSLSFDVIFAVDWTGVAAAEALLRGRKLGKNTKLIYLNFRVFARSAESPEERKLVRGAEARAVALSAASAALCDADAEDLKVLAEEELGKEEEEEEEEELGKEEEEEEVKERRKRPEIAVLLPPLRREFAEMHPPPPSPLEEEGAEEEGTEEASEASAAPEGASGKENDSSGRGSGSGRQQRRRTRRTGERRDLFLCCVRLSREKEPHRFVEVAECLSRMGVFRELGVSPALVGGGDSDYAEGLRERMGKLLVAVPSAAAAAGKDKGGRDDRASSPPSSSSSSSSSLVEGGFVSATALASRFFDRTLLNFHPCLADAYGMSCVEAGSRGAASVIHRRGEVVVVGGKEEEEEEGEGKVDEGKSRITVGASALLRADEGESIALDLSLPVEEVAARVAELLRGGAARGGKGGEATTKAAKSKPLSLSEIGENAQRRARSWGEKEHGEALAALARSVVAFGGGGGGGGV